MTAERNDKHLASSSAPSYASSGLLFRRFARCRSWASFCSISPFVSSHFADMASSSSSAATAPDNGLRKTAPAASEREISAFDAVEDDTDLYHGHLRSTHKDDGFTKTDARDMQRMGKAQELRRNFRLLSTIAFTVILQGTWEVLLTATYQGLVDGGLAGLFWSYIWTFIGFSFVMASLAEMASMAPTAGGQYHWVSEFAPPRWQKSLSYVTGWMSTLSWQAGTASGPYLVGTMIQSMIYVKKYPDVKDSNSILTSTR